MDFFYKNRTFMFGVFLCIDYSAMLYLDKITGDQFVYACLGTLGIVAGKRGVEVWKDRKIAGKKLSDEIDGPNDPLKSDNV